MLNLPRKLILAQQSLKAGRPKMTEWRIVHSTHDFTDAHIVAGRLKVEAIPVVVHHQPGASALGITVGRFGEIHVLVRPEDYDTALEILEPEDRPELPDTSNRVVYQSVPVRDDHDSE